ncbi:MAG TPA: hypothetical protein VIG99_27195 [Myxococcaceae bacterium]
MAVAVSDFCRRARAPAPAAEVRDALSLLSGDEDFRVPSVTDIEPAARPLGPYAVVDLLRGTAPELCAERQKVGYYDLARALADAREQPAPAPSDAPPPPPPASRRAEPHEIEAPAPEPERRGAARAASLSVAERIAPRRREKRPLPEPRGRFSQLPPQARPVEELLAPETRPELEALAVQYRHRVALQKALASQFQSRGKPPSEGEVREALERHGLLADLERRECELVLGSYAEQRGAAGRVAWALDMSPAELSRLTQALDLKNEVEELKERFRREALAPRPLAARLDLLGRDRYLADLGIKRRYLELAAAELRQALQKERPGGSDALEDRLEAAARRHGTTAAVLRRAMEQLGVSPD